MNVDGKVKMQNEEYLQGEPFAVLLFQLPANQAQQQVMQDRFLADPEFWRPFLGRMMLWAKPLNVTKTATDDGIEAVALLVDYNSDPGMLEQLCYEIGDALQCPAFTIVATMISEEEKRSILETPPPWDIASV